MRMAMAAVLVFILAPLYAAERVVLIEDFTNCGCGYCWNFEPSLNAWVNSHLAAGDVAVIRVHVNWPNANDPIYLANPTEQNARRNAYGVDGVPWVQVDGKIHASSSSSGLTSAFNNRIAVPTSLSISVARNGDDQTGTVSICLVAEEELSTGDPIRLYATIVEDSVPGIQYWAGDYFHQAFRDNLFGVAGPLVEFGAPYPDTVYFEAEYDITGWVPDNLYLATFVQAYTSTNKEVVNARWDKFMELQTGIESGFPMPPSPGLRVGPNPSPGSVSVTPSLPPGSAGTISVYDVSGRMVAETEAFDGWQESFSLNAAGVYIVRLVTDTGASVTRSVAVIR